MREMELRRVVGIVQPKIKENLDKIFDEIIPWEDKERYYIKMLEDKLILEKLLGQPVEIKTEIVW